MSYASAGFRISIGLPQVEIVPDAERQYPVGWCHEERLESCRPNWPLCGCLRHAGATSASALGCDRRGGRLPLSGADLLGGGKRGATMAVTIDAPPSRVWPWLVQMGCDRAGWYSWDRLDNGGVTSAWRPRCAPYATDLIGGFQAAGRWAADRPGLTTYKAGRCGRALFACQTRSRRRAPSIPPTPMTVPTAQAATLSPVGVESS
jgi:hypothetical protein